MNKQEVLDEIAALKEQLNNLEKFYDSFNPPNKRWRAEKGNIYYAITAEGIVGFDTEEATNTDNERYVFGNYFRTREEAEFEAERLKVIAELREYAIPINEFDWNDTDEHKFMLEIRNVENNLLVVIDCWHTNQTSDLVFESEEVAMRAIDSVGEDRIIKYYFRRSDKNGSSN